MKILFLVACLAGFVSWTNAQGIKIVKALPGDTVEKLARRNGADPVEVAKFNGLLPNSVLGAGREIKIPIGDGIVYPRPLPTPCFSYQKVELATSALPANFHGYDLRLVVESLEARSNLVKDEFETTAQFLERREKDQKKPLMGNIALNSPLLFEVEGVFKYDADREEMNVSFEVPNWSEMRSPYCEDAIARYRSPGVKVHFSDKPSNLGKTWKYTFPVKLTEARDLKPSLRLLLVATLGEHLGLAHTYDSKTYPYESYKMLGLKLTGFWIYNIKTGAIISKQAIGFDDIVPPKSKYADSVAAAKELFRLGKDDEVLAAVRKILAEDPMNAECYLLVGKVQTRRGDIDQAISALKTAIFWDNTLIEPHIALGNIYVAKGDCLQAKNYAASAIEINGDDGDAKTLKGLAERCH